MFFVILYNFKLDNLIPEEILIFKIKEIVQLILSKDALVLSGTQNFQNFRVSFRINWFNINDSHIQEDHIQDESWCLLTTFLFEFLQFL